MLNDTDTYQPAVDMQKQRDTVIDKRNKLSLITQINN